MFLSKHVAVNREPSRSNSLDPFNAVTPINDTHNGPLSRQTKTRSLGAQAIGAVAFGALAIGAIAIGRLAIGHARVRRLEIDELVVRRLRVTQALETPPAAESHSM